MHPLLNLGLPVMMHFLLIPYQVAAMGRSSTGIGVKDVMGAPVGCEVGSQGKGIGRAVGRLESCLG